MIIDYEKYLRIEITVKYYLKILIQTRDEIKTDSIASEDEEELEWINYLCRLTKILDRNMHQYRIIYEDLFWHVFVAKRINNLW